MLGDTQIIIEFEHFCHRCKYKKCKPHRYPCDECMSHPVSWNSARPVFFDEEEHKECHPRKKHSL